MPFIKSYYYFVFVLLFVSCKPTYTTNPQILEAETLMFSSPDSAYKLLCSIKKPQQLPEADYAAWCLHYTHARYKLYIDEKSDSLIRFASNYYQKNGPDKYAGTALYLQGCLTLIKNKNTIAMNYYKKAIDYLEHTQEYDITGLSYLNIGFIYIKNELYNEPNKYLNTAIKLFKITNNKKYIYFSYRLLAEVSYKIKQPIKITFRYLNCAEKLANANNDQSFNDEIQSFKGKVLVDSNIVESKSYLLQAFQKIKNKNNVVTGYLSYIYSQENNFDSARYYYNYVNVYDSTALNKFFYETINLYLSKSKKDYKSAFFHCEKAFDLREEMFKKENKELLVRMDKQYDLSKKEAERAKLEIENREKIIVISILSVLILVGLLIHLQVRNRNKLKQKHLLLEQQTLKHELENKKHENSQNIALLQANILNKIENTLKFKRLQIGLINKGKLDEFQNEITQQSIFSESDLHFYMHEADKLFNSNISKLQTEFPQLTTNDLIVISLICLGIDLNNCCILLSISLNTLYVRRKRLKVHLCLDKNVNLDQWLVSKIVNNAQN
jgi:hypothetical protein